MINNPEFMGGQVFIPSLEEQDKYGSDTVVKRILSPFRDEHIRQAGKSKLAYDLFPNNFPQVKGSECISKTESIDDETDLWIYRQAVYLQRVPISPAQLTFSQHSFNVRGKRSYCQCESCKKHVESVTTPEALSKVKSFAKEAKQTGIIVNPDDLTNFSLTDSSIYFFKPDSIYLWRTYLHLNRQPILTPNQQEILSSLHSDLRINEKAWLQRALISVYSRVLSIPYEEK